MERDHGYLIVYLDSRHLVFFFVVRYSPRQINTEVMLFMTLGLVGLVGAAAVDLQHRDAEAPMYGNLTILL
ncbi:hypothetical protein BS50DRAFT_571575, partial [Corynespora cassiicola Philippines]